MAMDNISWLRGTTCALAFGALTAAGGAVAAEERGRPLCTGANCPDLIINIEDSTAFDPRNLPSCDFSRPITSGYIAIKNIGEGSARLRSTGDRTAEQLGLARRGPETWLAIYNPYNLHYRALNTTTEPPSELFQTDGLDPFDQKGYRYSFGDEAHKQFRNFDSPELSAGTGQRLSGRDEIRLIQDALNELIRQKRLKGPEITVDGAYGEGTRVAIERYQRSRGEEITGILTRRQRDALFGKVFNTKGAQTRVCVDIYALVDPNNLVEESNEANNIAAWRVEIDCSPPAPPPVETAAGKAGDKAGDKKAGAKKAARVKVIASNQPDYDACVPRF